MAIKKLHIFLSIKFHPCVHTIDVEVDTMENKKNYSSPFDPNGSYTGVPAEDEYEIPVQDADDL